MAMGWLSRRIPNDTVCCIIYVSIFRIILYVPHVRWQTKAVELLGHKKDWNYPKFFANRKYKEAIDWLGSSLIVSASSGEATHKQLKGAWRHTNKQGDAAVDQVMPSQRSLQEILHHGLTCSLAAVAVNFASRRESS